MSTTPTMNTSTDPLEGLKRTIALIYGILNNGNPFWAFVAVKLNKYPMFLAELKEGKLDLAHFEGYGEIIICGEGKSPPDDVTLKVAEMYQTDPNQFKQNVDDNVKRSMPQLDKVLDNQS